VLFQEGTQSLTGEYGDYLDEVANIVKDSYKKEVVVYSYSESEALAKSRGDAVMNEIVKRAVLPSTAVKTAPRFIPGLAPKYSKIEVVIQ